MAMPNVNHPIIINEFQTKSRQTEHYTSFIYGHLRHFKSKGTIIQLQWTQGHKGDNMTIYRQSQSHGKF